MNAVIIPVHPPKAGWLLAFLNSLKIHARPGAVRLVIACSNHADLSFFARTLAAFRLQDGVELINLQHHARYSFGQQEVDQTLERAGQAIINRKKFLALHWAMKQGIPYSIVIDSDVLCLPNVDLDRFVRRVASNYDKNIQWGAELGPELDGSIFSGINGHSLHLLSGDDQAEAISRSLDKIYTWFLDPPCYRLDDLERFFGYMADIHGGDRRFFDAVSWHAFDNVVFTYFRALHCGTEIASYGQIGIDQVPESLSAEQLSALHYAVGFQPAWLTFVASLNSPFSTPAAFDGCGMLYHCDRVKGLEVPASA